MATTQPNTGSVRAAGADPAAAPTFEGYMQYLNSPNSFAGFISNPPKLQYAVVSEGKHKHLFARVKGSEKWTNVACLGGVPQGMYCNWETQHTYVVNKRIRESTVWRMDPDLIGLAYYTLAPDP